ncbi:hypothetical protein MCOR31_002081 [Pyricularia oryzae]|nr:hypothetical protein MCOR31_002081 [Pyricularia oryzae]KAI6393405.1 hypothetical protein MCOR24_009769 [Pyricularia oryzae]
MAEHAQDSAMPTSMQPESPVHNQSQLEVAPASAGQKRSLDEASEDEPALDQQNAPASSSHASPVQKKLRMSDPGIGESEVQNEDAIPASPGSPELEPTETSNMDIGGDDDNDDDEDEDQDANDGDDEEGNVEEATQKDDKAATAAGPRDWNSASHKVVRTLFGAALPTLKTRGVLNRIGADSTETKNPNVAESKADASNDKAGVESAASNGDAVTTGKSRSRSKSKSRSRSGSEAPDRSTMRRKSIDWKLPELKLDGKVGRKKQFLAWCEEFCSDNVSNVAKADARLLRRGYLIRLEATSIPEQVRKESKKAARNTESSQVDKIVSGFVGNGEESSELSEGEIMSESEPDDKSENKPSSLLDKQLQQLPGSGGSGKIQLSREEELEQLRLYFPRASKTDFCVICAKNGHRANDCPPPTCRHCQNQDHTSAQCPKRVRCTKCQHLGHIKKSCPEKLASAAGEAELECAVCCATDHLEDDCESLWCTYYPDPENIVKVQSIPAFCYSCGADNHFGGDCGLYSNISTHSKDDTWTVANRDLYVDPDTDVLPVSWVPPPPPDPERPDFGGRSIVPQRNHIYFESDDEEEGEFIQPPVRSRGPPPGRQQIRINGSAGASAANGTGGGRQRESRNQRRNDGGGGGGGGRSGRNPPLPPGPPPSSLPARPPGGQSGGGSSRGGAGGGRRGRGGFSRVRGGHR